MPGGAGLIRDTVIRFTRGTRFWGDSRKFEKIFQGVSGGKLTKIGLFSVDSDNNIRLFQ